jgi:NAD(P)-dependent dehydrogenase (short-subunit alcohol dehydrogenase family)
LTTEFTEEEYERLFRINVKSLFQSSQVIIPHLAKNGGGSIINISSSGDPRPRPEGVWYGATKAAVSNVLSHPLVFLTVGNESIGGGMG